MNDLKDMSEVPLFQVLKLIVLMSVACFGFIIATAQIFVTSL